MENIEQKLISRINEHAAPIRIMHVCGTHERTISKYAIRDIISKDVQLLSGPGCPVCVTPAEDIDFAISLAKSGKVIASFGDMMRVPGTRGSLFDARSDGYDIRMVYSIDDAVKIAKDNPTLDIVFFGIGFETTAPANAAALLREVPENFSMLTSHKLMPPAMEILTEDTIVDGFLAPGHVSTIIGTYPYNSVSERGFPIVVTGFEVLDVLLGIAMVQNQIESGRSCVENAYSRCVNVEGNLKAQEMMYLVFKKIDSKWRGIGMIEKSGLALKKEFEQFDAVNVYADIYEKAQHEKKVSDIDNNQNEMWEGCICAEILTARAQPAQCPLFGKRCSPKNPVGPCMVSLEGTCYNWYKYTHNKGI
ncbi:hydrogenase expression/formation protein HypD [Methanococcoides vulcani]|uniref:Hydrogenase expression/formation protein HypD n=1 Tax=Methanococcoides vulcani TaxID=1353158 RepID=A0A1H9YE77_9EURY|nr:hydrogenase formation protein HypD [Methanococcoides vulcani]SES67170.1 hydrogenase expression/formation protein HypD [Methanococcoides vulcani]